MTVLALFIGDITAILDSNINHVKIYYEAKANDITATTTCYNIKESSIKIFVSVSMLRMV